MELKDAKISLLFGERQTTITLHDGGSGTTFAEITLTPDQLSSALSRIGHTPCKIQLFGLDRVNKKLEIDNFRFEIPNKKPTNDQLLWLCKKALKESGKEDWTPDNDWNSQTTFVSVGNKNYAQTTIRRWV